MSANNVNIIGYALKSLSEVSVFQYIALPFDFWGHSKKFGQQSLKVDWWINLKFQLKIYWSVLY